MKKKKVIFPAMAIIFAIGAALATNASPKKSVDVNVSIRGAACEKVGKCVPGGSLQCKSGSNSLDAITSGANPTCSAYNDNGTFQ